LRYDKKHRNTHIRQNNLSQISKMKIAIYSGIVCLLSLIQYPSSSSSIVEDVGSAPNIFDANDGYFTSNIDLQKLLSTEEAIMFELQEYVRNEEKRIEKLKGYINEYEKIRTEASQM